MPELVRHHEQDTLLLDQHSANRLLNSTYPQSPNDGGIDDADDLASDVAVLALSAAGREAQYFGPSSALSFARVAGATFGLHRRHDGSTVDAHNDTRSADQHRSLEPLQLPSFAVCQRLSRAYFENIHPQYPFLHKPTFGVWEEQCLHAQQRGTLEAAPKVALLFVLMVYAIGSLIVDNAQQDAAETYYEAALDRLQPVVDMDSLESIQAVLACAVYSIRSPAGASIWKLSGMAIRHCIELGYHRSAARFRPKVDPLTSEMSKRVFWVAYDIDRAAAFALGRPFGIPDEQIDVELPSDIDDSAITSSGLVGVPRTNVAESPGPLSGALHIIKLRQLWSKMSDSLFSATATTSGSVCRRALAAVPLLRNQLDSWKDAIPLPCEPPAEGHSTVFGSNDWFRLAYCHSILLLYRHYLTCSRNYGPGHDGMRCSPEEVDAAFQECSDRAREICLLYRRTYQRSPVRYTWGSLHILFLGGLTYLHCLWASPTVRRKVPQKDVISTCTACAMVLVIIAERWSNAAPYRDIFEELAERTVGMICEPPESQNRFQVASSPKEPGKPVLFHRNSPPFTSLDDSEVTQVDDWMLNLGHLNVPDESEWLVEDLLRGFTDPQDDMQGLNNQGF
ncbi:uncharacterized protein HMPREF1541_03275 [Cyphellophora europaea CBS 101466]|uniref:Xylanolytic transcriptional activator regulatory domain-containing protein n=1 Tax=Cyphellophora europaea (strain CBS 101466) TaxID=1220924 RepID=W2RYD3_CYPE1|nr:uncharacterized protein HMPREF1541_03275 [Cyphellophora europaea CBS 101466]ETN41340.1 hypothetical protein HMPREF1541_03275 [Cyphellophora europaea CBS 101466]